MNTSESTLRKEMSTALTWLENRMEKQLTELKVDIKEGFNRIEDKFDKLPNSFATKEEHITNVADIKYMKEKQAKVDKIFAIIATTIWTTILWALLALIIKMN